MRILNAFFTCRPGVPSTPDGVFNRQYTFFLLGFVSCVRTSYPFFVWS